MNSTWLVVGMSAFDREQAISTVLNNAAINDGAFPKSAILIEGLSDGKSLLESNDQTIVARIASGCLCCSNNMIMRIYLNRLIRQKPQHLFLSLSTDTHLDQIRQFLSTPDYAEHVGLIQVLNLNPTMPLI
jgi:G3E family GTPase